MEKGVSMQKRVSNYYDKARGKARASMFNGHISSLKERQYSVTSCVLSSATNPLKWSPLLRE